jgi:tRNA (cytidine/uridine-2'-O-)-methyltransferase
MMNIVLIEPKIPQNTGTIARLCAAIECKLTLVGPLGFSLDDKYLKRAGLDYWDYVDWEHLECTDTYIQNLKVSNTVPYLLSSKVSQSYTQVRYSNDQTLIFGSETLGLSEGIKSAFSEQCITIPMKSPHIRSLNLANAVSIVAYEALRQLEVKG